jgi:hypothetical protein
MKYAMVFLCFSSSVFANSFLQYAKDIASSLIPKVHTARGNLTCKDIEDHNISYDKYRTDLGGLIESKVKEAVDIFPLTYKLNPKKYEHSISSKYPVFDPNHPSELYELGPLAFKLRPELGIFICDFDQDSCSVENTVFIDDASEPQHSFASEPCTKTISSEITVIIRLPVFILGEFEEFKLFNNEIAEPKKFMQGLTLNITLTLKPVIKFTLEGDVLKFDLNIIDAGSLKDILKFNLEINNHVIDGEKKLTKILNATIEIADELTRVIKIKDYSVEGQLKALNDKLGYKVHKLGHKQADEFSQSNLNLGIDALLNNLNISCNIKDNQLKCFNSDGCSDPKNVYYPGSHISDFENVRIKLNDQGVPQKISLSFHGDLESRDWGKEIVSKYQDTHPEIYVAKHSHGTSFLSKNRVYKGISFSDSNTITSITNITLLEDEFSPKGKDNRWKSFNKIEYLKLTSDNRIVNIDSDEVNQYFNSSERIGNQPSRCLLNKFGDEDKNACLLVDSPPSFFYSLVRDTEKREILFQGYKSGQLNIDEKDVEKYQDLAKKYAPVFYFHKDEEYFPSNITVIDKYFEKTGNRWVTKKPFTAEDTDNFSKPKNSKLSWLASSIKDSVLYVVIIKVNGGVIFDYWFYYPYNMGKPFCVSESILNAVYTEAK